MLRQRAVRTPQAPTPRVGTREGAAALRRRRASRLTITSSGLGASVTSALMKRM